MFEGKNERRNARLALIGKDEYDKNFHKAFQDEITWENQTKLNIMGSLYEAMNVTLQVYSKSRETYMKDPEKCVAMEKAMDEIHRSADKSYTPKELSPIEIRDFARRNAMA